MIRYPDLKFSDALCLYDTSQSNGTTFPSPFNSEEFW